jgi:hypothetical protein
MRAVQFDANGERIGVQECGSTTMERCLACEAEEFKESEAALHGICPCS